MSLGLILLMSLLAMLGGGGGGVNCLGIGLNPLLVHSAGYSQQPSSPYRFSTVEEEEENEGLQQQQQQQQQQPQQQQQQQQGNGEMAVQLPKLYMSRYGKIGMRSLRQMPLLDLSSIMLPLKQRVIWRNIASAAAPPPEIRLHRNQAKLLTTKGNSVLFDMLVNK